MSNSYNGAESTQYDEYIKHLKEMQAQAYPAAAGTPQTSYPPTRLQQMITDRLRATTPPWSHIHPVKINDKTVAIFLVVNEKPLVIEDEWNLFPSDTLITQLRMLT